MGGAHVDSAQAQVQGGRMGAAAQGDGRGPAANAALAGNAACAREAGQHHAPPWGWGYQ
jgi:hypothetical protein